MSSEDSLFAIPIAGAPASESSSLQGHCPRCKVQIMWTREKFNMGIQTFFDMCPKCFADYIDSKSPDEATQEIESLQRNFEDLLTTTSSSLKMARDIRRIQMELQFLMIDIEQDGSSQGLDTSNYQLLAGKLAASLEERVGLIVEDSANGYDETPSLLQQVKELLSDMEVQLERHKKGGLVGLTSAYALLDILKQLEQVQSDDKLSMSSASFTEDDCEELQGEVDNLCHHFEDIENALINVPALSQTSGNVSVLRERYLRLSQDIGGRRSTSENEEKEELRRKIHEIERQHAAEVEALREQLDTFMSTPVAANVVAVPEQGINCSTSSVVEAEVVGTFARHQHVSTTMAIAEPVSPRRVVTPPVASMGRQYTHRDHLPSNRVINQHTAFNHSSVTAAIEKIAHTEVVSDIILTMTNHPTSPHIQSAALMKLGELTRDWKKSNTGEINAVTRRDHELQVNEYRHKIGMTNGIALILKALRTFPVDVKVQTCGLLAIGNVSRNSIENTSMIGDADAIDLILKAMRHFVQDIQLQRNGLFALYTLSFNNTKNKAAIRDQGGVPLLLRSMRHYPKDFEVQRNGLTCIGNLASKDGKNRLQIAEYRGIDIVFAAMTQFPQNVSIQDRACLTIAFLAKSPETQKALRRKGAITFIKKAATVIGDTKSSVVNALHALEAQTLSEGYAV